MIIDFHTHVFPPRIKQDRSEYVERDACFAALYSDKKTRLATAEELIESMDRDGVDVSVALNIGWTSHKLRVETNDYIMESINRYPKRLVGFCAVQPTSSDLTLKEIERCAKGGMKGIGELRPDIQGVDIKNIRLIKPFVDEIKKHNLILLTHSSEPVGHGYQGKGEVTPNVLYSLISDFPGLTLVCAHWGGGLPFYALMPEVRRAISNVFFDTAASPFLYTPKIYEQVIQLVGAEKILFGSDYPLLGQKRVFGEITSLDLPEETKNLILAGNAKKLLGV